MRKGVEASATRMQPTAAVHTAAAHAAQQHNHLVNVHYPEHAPPSLTPRKRNCGCTLGLHRTAAGAALRGAPRARVALHRAWRTRASPRACAPRLTAASTRPRTAAEPIVLGLWDERKSVTALQLIVCLSLALGVDENAHRGRARGLVLLPRHGDARGRVGHGGHQRRGLALLGRVERAGRALRGPARHQPRAHQSRRRAALLLPPPPP